VVTTGQRRQEEDSCAFLERQRLRIGGSGAGMPHVEGAGPHVGGDFLRADDDGSRGSVV
jgi:hypothetical protein